MTFSELLPEYLEYKRSVGFQYGQREEAALRKMCSFLDGAGGLTEESALAYVHADPSLSASTIHARQCRVRQFALFSNRARGAGSYVLPLGATLRLEKGLFVPYIFTKSEIKSILRATDALTNSPKHPHRRIFFQTIIRLLYCTGMRITEALALSRCDVDFERSTLVVRGGKGNVSRLVPFNPYVASWLRAYDETQPEDRALFFLSRHRGKSMKAREAVGKTFREVILKAAGIPRRSDGRGPRLHDLRHTFACHCLDAMSAGGKDQFCFLPYVSRYMGHKGIESTEYYMRLTESRHDEIRRYGVFGEEAGL